MPSQYIPILIYAVLAASFPAVSLMVFKLIRPDMKANGAKLEPYECGVPPEGNARGRYSVRFYMVAILFVIFDVETIFLFPRGSGTRPSMKLTAGGIDVVFWSVLKRRAASRLRGAFCGAHRATAADRTDGQRPFGKRSSRKTAGGHGGKAFYSFQA
jgi:NADH:ubiquinone oxidoreductase subunit 3 (subunit A)